MTLKELLSTGKDFDCELFGSYDTRASFVWDDDISLTDEGYKHFQPIMDCPITCLSNGNIEVLVGNDPDDRLPVIAHHQAMISGLKFQIKSP